MTLPRCPAQKAAALVGVYHGILGGIFLFAPNIILKHYGAATDEPWIRILGALYVLMGISHAIATVPLHTGNRSELIFLLNRSVSNHIILCLFYLGCGFLAQPSAFLLREAFVQGIVSALLSLGLRRNPSSLQPEPPHPKASHVSSDESTPAITPLRSKQHRRAALRSRMVKDANGVGTALGSVQTAAKAVSRSSVPEVSVLKKHSWTTMSATARSLYVFSWYMISLGVMLVFVPNQAVGLFGLGPTSEIWLRLIGIFALVFGRSYMLVAQHHLTQYYTFTIGARLFTTSVYISMYLFGFASSIGMPLFGTGCVMGATSTVVGLLKDQEQREQVDGAKDEPTDHGARRSEDRISAA